jgi:hypothetical protein
MVVETRIPVPGKRIAARLIEEQAYLLDPRKEELQCLNEVGSFLWARIGERRFSVSDLGLAVVEHFEVSAEEAAKDIRDFLAELESRGFIDYMD